MYTREQVLEAIENRLDENEREVIIIRFGLEDGIPRPLSEIQARLGVSRE